MIDTDKYEGQAEGEWIIQVLDDGLTWNIQTKSGEQLADMVIGKHHGNAKLMRDAPLLLEEVKRLRERLDLAERYIIEPTLTRNYFADVVSKGLDDERDNLG